VANAPTGSISAWLGNEADIRTNYDAVSGATVPV
ncbi:TPA: Bbp16 family capsid cement protein, partial [Acinetobacter baumannii]